MKLCFALILSAAIHFAAGVLINQALVHASPIKHHRPMIVTFKHYQSEAPAKSLAKTLGNKTQNNQTSQSAPLADYLSEQDVEIKALPVSNIDHSKLTDVFISGLPIKMRLYINSEGRVMKVEKLAVLEQDHELQVALEKILPEMTFIPAKKNGLAVNSYQDIAFSFN